MRRIFLPCAMVLVFSGGAPSWMHAQISPGELSAAHASLEGISACTSCHELGRAVPDEKCLACHGEIRVRMQEQRGLHALYAGRHCVQCHKEHHGRNFSPIRFERQSLDHAQTGFQLEGAHLRVDCAQCHRRENIKAQDVLALPRASGSGTYLGLSRECAACHADVHRGQLGAACGRCHTAAAWKPAPRFSHEQSRFQLTGAHVSVRCEKCHALRTGNATAFRGIPFATCASCHTDPHGGRFTQPCAECHSPSGWKEGASRAFNHADTRFPLTGKHAAVPCVRCHSTRQFHITKFELCSDCHRDVHAGQFAGRSNHGACGSCHTSSSFSPATFSVADHQSGRFPLSGAHAATPCLACHRSPEGLLFRWVNPGDCRTCHKDPHNGGFDEFMPSGCQSCHTTEQWSRVAYAHDRTRFPLTGAHASLTCARCHIVAGNDRVPLARDAGTLPRRALRWDGEPACALCHADRHGGQFGQTPHCERCHTTRTWNELLFSHDSTTFSLTGAHSRVPCERCHPAAEPGVSGSVRRFAGTPGECSACHKPRLQ